MSAAALSPFLRPEEAEEALGRGLAVACRPVASADELALHFEIRHRVFVQEQGVFPASDRDAHDDAPATVHVLGLCGDVAGGAVRLYPIDGEGLWKGDRLAVLPLFRSGAVKGGMGGPLVRFAVRAAAERGGSRMVAHIQPPNVAFFEHLGWFRLGGLVPYAGMPHQMMAIDL